MNRPYPRPHRPRAGIRMDARLDAATLPTFADIIAQLRRSRHAMCLVMHADFPPSWRAGDIAGRSDESGYDDRKFGLRLDEVTLRKLETLTKTFQRSAAEIIRQLITQAMPEDFPESWLLAAEERRQRGSQSGKGDR